MNRESEQTHGCLILRPRGRGVELRSIVRVIKKNLEGKRWEKKHGRRTWDGILRTK
jgi:hypothetical protein